MIHLALVRLLPFWGVVTITTMAFAQTTASNSYNFGRVGLKAPVEHTFEFQNERPEALEVRNVQMTAPLTVTKMTSRVEPGSTGAVSIRLDEPRVKGEFRGQVAVNFKNEGVPPLMFSTAGELVPPIEFAPFAAFFVSTQRGTPTTGSIEITSNEAEPLEILNVVHSSSRFTTNVETLEKGRRFRLSLTVKAEAPAGRETETIELVTSSREHPFLKVQANTNVNERVYVFPTSINFDAISVLGLKSGSQAVRDYFQELMVYQVGGKDFQVSASTDVPFLRLTPHQADLKDRFGISVEVVPEALKGGDVNGSITITTNDSDFPSLTIPVKAMVEGSW